MLLETDEQLTAAAVAAISSSSSSSPTHVIVPVGAGSIAQAVTQHFKGRSRLNRIRGSNSSGASEGKTPFVIAVEPSAAACLQTSMRAGESTSIETKDTIMCGMNCGTLSTPAWPILRDGVDACVTVSDAEAHAAVRQLAKQQQQHDDDDGGKMIEAGPCGAAALAALVKLRAAPGDVRKALRLDGSDEVVVVLYCTEGKRVYDVPV